MDTHGARYFSEVPFIPKLFVRTFYIANFRGRVFVVHKLSASADSVFGAQVQYIVQNFKVVFS